MTHRSWRADRGLFALTRRSGARALLRFASTALLAVAAGCSSGVSVAPEGQFPTPLVVPLQLDVGLVLDDPLTEFVYDEEIKDHGHWRVEAGALQGPLYRTILGAMFRRVVEFDNVSTATGVSGTIVPEIADFQVSIPQLTRSDFYEVWIKYVIRLYDRDGTLVVEWPLTAYGKASREDYGMLQDSDKPGMEDATVTALRDAGAFLSLRFAEVPEVKSWLGREGAGGSE
jgi:hypothetical protein